MHYRAAAAMCAWRRPSAVPVGPVALSLVLLFDLYIPRSADTVSCVFCACCVTVHDLFLAQPRCVQPLLQSHARPDDGEVGRERERV